MLGPLEESDVGERTETGPQVLLTVEPFSQTVCFDFFFSNIIFLLIYGNFTSCTHHTHFSVLSGLQPPPLHSSDHPYKRRRRQQRAAAAKEEEEATIKKMESIFVLPMVTGAWSNAQWSAP